MANVDYTFAWRTKNRYDVLLTPIVARTRTLLAEAVAPLGGMVLGTARVIDDLIQVRIRADDSISTLSLKKRMKGVLSHTLMQENSDIYDDYYAKHMFDRDLWLEEGTTADATVDSWAAEKAKYNRP